MSPELVNNLSYNEKSDVWSLGCMMYELCALTPPFTASNQHELNRKIRIGKFPRLPLQYSMELDMIIRKMIQVEVTRRPSIDSLLTDRMVQQRRELLQSNTASRKMRPDETNHDFDSTEKLKNNLLTKMRQLELKEKELESRERSVALSEKLAEEKLKRATLLLDEAGHKDDSSAVPQSFSNKPDTVTIKRHGTFHAQLYNKENFRQKTNMELISDRSKPDEHYKDILQFNYRALENQLGGRAYKILPKQLLQLRLF